jgi:DNA-binding MarR family transcriptional regulator
MDYPFRETLPFYLTQISNHLSDVFSESLSEFDISIPMYRVLVVLQDGQSRMLNQIAQTLEVEQSTLSRQITTMVKLGLVSRARPDENGRIVQIEITAHGKHVVTKMVPVAQGLETLALGDCTSAEIDALKQTLHKIYTKLI